MDVLSEEIVIVGSRYGELADVVIPLFEKGEPINSENIVSVLGGDEVILRPDDNKFDSFAVAVYTVSQRLLGYVWMYQSHAMRQWMESHQKRFVKGRITSLIPKVGVMTATMDIPMLLEIANRYNPTDMEWADNLPEVLVSITGQSLCLSIDLLQDELQTATEWTERLQRRIDNLLRFIPMDLSANSYMECIELYCMMKQSPIEEVRKQSEYVLNSFVSRGSAQQMQWWVEHWLPDFFQSAAEGDLLGMFQADRYTLERVEEELIKAPNHLFHHFTVNRSRFAWKLYYSALPQPLYNRLLTLLAVREAMLAEGDGRKEDDNELTAALIAKAIAACKALMWGNAAYAVPFCVCRDVYHAEDNTASFERLLAEGGTVIPEGTINTAINRNSWMKYHIDKWQEKGVKYRVLKLRDAFIAEMENIKKQKKTP